MTYKNKQNKNREEKKKENMCNQWHSLPSEGMAVQVTAQHSSNSLCLPTVVFEVGSVFGERARWFTDAGVCCIQ